MNVSLQSGADYSYLFRSLNSSKGNSVSNLNFLSDYGSIRNGSYLKLLKAYYTKDGSNSAVSSIVKTNSISSDDTKTLVKVQSSTDALKESAYALCSTGKNSIFTQKEITTTAADGTKTSTTGYDTDTIYKALSQFVTDYNSVMAVSDDVTSTSILSKTKNLINNTASNSKLLSSVGITINSDNSLSLNKETFVKGDMNTVKSLFNGTGSYAYRVSAQASLINFAADHEASKANTYSYNGNYSNTYSSGSMFSALF